MRSPVGSVYASDVPLGQSFFIMPTIYRTMIALTVENIIFNRIFVGPDEHAQSVHNASSLLSYQSLLFTRLQKGMLRRPLFKSLIAVRSRIVVCPEISFVDACIRVLGIVRFEKQTDGTRRRTLHANPDVESGLKN